jgi:ABC-type polysaccharide/polyol phosphate export permease
MFAARSQHDERSALPSPAPSGKTTSPILVKGAAIEGLQELLGGIGHWRISHLIRDLRHRYTRSKLGQLWLMISTASMIAALSAVWSLLWHQLIQDLMPFIGVSLIVWSYLPQVSQVLVDCTSAFVSHGHLYRNQTVA